LTLPERDPGDLPTQGRPHSSNESSALSQSGICSPGFPQLTTGNPLTPELSKAVPPKLRDVSKTGNGTDGDDEITTMTQEGGGGGGGGSGGRAELARAVAS
jgi:hypothetical protein